MEENQIGKNVSSGAKKVEAVEEEARARADAAAGKSTAKRTHKTSSATQTKRKKSPAAKTSAEPKQEPVVQEEPKTKASLKAEKKERKLLHKAELKQKALEKKAALAEKKLQKKATLAEKKAERKARAMEHKAQLKEKRSERRAEKIARRELLKSESKSERRNRIEREKKERLALRRQKQEAKDKAREEKIKAREAAHARKAEDKKHKREQNTERKKNRTPGFGGWLAAVISLGVACLALATVVTAGSFRMNDMAMEAENSYHATLYEMVSVSEQMDDNLSKLRVASGSNEQKQLLTDIMIDAALMESAIERIPLDAVTSTDISAFVNKTNDYCRTLLNKLNKGGTLSATEKNTVSYLYNVNDKLYNELNNLATHMTEKEFRAFINGKQGSVSEKFGEIGQGTLMRPEETVDAPFSGEGNVGENQLESLEEISLSRAEELVKEYLNGYHIRDVQFSGETVARMSECYNFVLTDENDVEIDAQISKRGGKLVFFDTYEVCTQKNFDLESCDNLARAFLASVGIGNVEAVWLSDAGMVADITYVSVENGVRAYPDMIHVRVCESRGRVVGMEAMGYYLNNAERNVRAELTQEEALAKLSSELRPYEAHLAVVPIFGQEVLAYEFACAYGENEMYIVYIDANTGDEVQVYRVRESASGSYLR